MIKSAKPVKEHKTTGHPKDMDERLEAVNLAMQQIQKNYGAGAIMRFGETSPESRQIKAIST